MPRPWLSGPVQRMASSLLSVLKHSCDPQATDIHHDVTALGNDANKGKTGLTSAGHDATQGKGGLKTAEQDLTKGKQGVTGAEHDVTKGKSDVTKAEGAAK